VIDVLRFDEDAFEYFPLFLDSAIVKRHEYIIWYGMRSVIYSAKESLTDQFFLAIEEIDYFVIPDSAENAEVVF
jgi:hypothetical protein